MNAENNGKDKAPQAGGDDLFEFEEILNHRVGVNGTVSNFKLDFQFFSSCFAFFLKFNFVDFLG